MGLYDRLYSEYKLPDIIDHDVKFVFGEDNFYSNIEFHTKNFECVLNEYTISENGRLLLLDEDEDFHGRIIFYTRIIQNDKLYILDYHAKFTNGNIVSVWGEISQCFSNL